MKFITKRNHGNGWYLAKPLVDGARYEVTVNDGTNTFCENIRCASLSEAYEHCKARIDAAASMRPKPVDPTNTDTPPACKPDCPYRQKFDGYDRQRNALRMETASLVQPERCGWNIKPGKFGGNPLDYEACIFTGS